MLALAGLPALAALACSAASRPAGEPVVAPARVPVVLVPGATGTELVDAGSGALTWGSGARLLFPRDRGRSMVLPIDGAAPAAVAGRVLDTIGFPPLYRKPIYRPVVASFEAAGWRAGDLAAPRAGDTFLTFAYDWRRDAVHSAAELLAGLERLRLARGEERLTADLVCQSNGAHVCRYLVKHGAVPLAEAEAGRGALPERIRIRRVVLVGASNAGSVRIFAMLHRGRRYAPAGRLFAPETVFTFPAFYQDLPARDGRIFVDAAGRPLAADVFAADDWVRHGWSVFDPHLARRLDRERPRGLGDGAARLEFLRRQLAGARRFQALLARDAPVGATRYYLVQEAGRPTPRGGMIEPRGDGWRTSFPGDRRVDARPALRRRLTAPGDGHATLASQGSLAPAEAAALGAAPLRAAGGHFEMINSREALRWLVAVLAAPDAAAGPGR